MDSWLFCISFLCYHQCYCESALQVLVVDLKWQKLSKLYSDLSDTEKMQRYVNEEKNIREENLRLQRKLQLEVERREALCRHLSESESR